MIYHQAKDPNAYQTIFYRQIGLKKQEEETGNSWRNDEGGYIYTFGTMDTIQMGIGEYTVPVDFLSEFQYDTEYLHAGIIYEGVTYSLVDNHMKEFATPSAFLAMEQAAGGINCWKKGQHFKGVEISVELGYLRNTSSFPGSFRKGFGFSGKKRSLSSFTGGTAGSDLSGRAASSETRNDGESFKISCCRVCIPAGASGNLFCFCEWRGDAHRKDQSGEKRDPYEERGFSENHTGS